MSMSFLGVTNQRSSKVVFVVDISTSLMDIKKGGFRAFDILRHEISRLVSTLPPANEFNIFLFDGPDEKAEKAQKNLSTVASRNGGKFNLLTTKRLEELSKRAENETP